MDFFRHGRACPGHPRISCTYFLFEFSEDVDARDKPGHDELFAWPDFAGRFQSLRA